MNISKLKQNPKIFGRLFGIQTDKFDELIKKVSPIWDKAEVQRKTSHSRKARIGGGRPYALTLEESTAIDLTL